MIIVPLVGDTVKTSTGLESKVLSFTNTLPDGPAVFVRGAGATSETVMFTDIVKINGIKVRYVKSDDGYKVFETDGAIKRKYDLPQPGDKIEAEVPDVGSSVFVVKRVRLNMPNDVSGGMMFDVVDEGADEIVRQARFASITNVLSRSLFDKKAFQQYYADYAGKAAS